MNSYIENIQSVGYSQVVRLDSIAMRCLAQTRRKFPQRSVEIRRSLREASFQADHERGW